MHAKHDYNPVKTAYPVDSIEPFDEGDFESRVIVETENSLQTEEDLRLLDRMHETPFHQSRNFQGSQAYTSQSYEPSSSEFESKVSWGLVIGCLVLVLFGILFGAGIFSIILFY